MIASFAAMALLYVLISKLVPLISIWELKVGEQPKSKMAASVHQAQVSEELS